MFLFYVLSFFKKGDTIQGRDIIQGRTLFKEIRYLKQLESELSLVSIHPTQWHISFSRHGPCVQEWYEVMTSKDATMIRKGNKTNLFAVVLNLGSTDIEVREDVTLVNFNGLISSVGGSLGLFLGFSFYQFLLSVMYFLMSRTG